MLRFVKLTGSGNDFIFVDRRGEPEQPPMTTERIRALCARGTGVGADGIVLLESDPDADVRIRYFNSDGSLAALCGNATLCTARLATDLGLGDGGTLRIATDSGTVRARLSNGVPEFEVSSIERVAPTVPIACAGTEQAIGYALVGVPHLVVVVSNLEGLDLVGRGRVLRSHPWTGAPGANVNFVEADRRGGWTMRTYERGVEAETLACGTGTVASATLLRAWGRERADRVRIWSRSGEPLDVTVTEGPNGWSAALRGEGRVVFRGAID